MRDNRRRMMNNEKEEDHGKGSKEDGTDKQ